MGKEHEAAMASFREDFDEVCATTFEQLAEYADTLEARVRELEGERDGALGVIEPRYELVGSAQYGEVLDRERGYTLGPQPIVHLLNALEDGSAIRWARGDAMRSEQFARDVSEENSRLIKRAVDAENELEIVRRFAASTTNDAATKANEELRAALRKHCIGFTGGMKSWLCIQCGGEWSRSEGARGIEGHNPGCLASPTREAPADRWTKEWPTEPGWWWVCGGSDRPGVPGRPFPGRVRDDGKLDIGATWERGTAFWFHPMERPPEAPADTSEEGS